MIHISYNEALDKIAVEVAKEVKNGMILGLGSGSAVAGFLKHLKERVRAEDFDVTVIPSSLQIQMMAEDSGLNIGQPHLIPRIDLAVDGADQIDMNFNMIKGGGGALFKEKVIISASKRTIILSDETKYVNRLNKSVPIEVSPFAKNFVAHKLISLKGRPKPRVLNKGYPYITENGNLIFDTDFGEIDDPKDLELKLGSIPGVIAVGIFTMKADIFYKGLRDGSFEKVYGGRG